MYFPKLPPMFVAVFSQLVSSQALTAWYTSVGPQVIYQNASTGDLYYCLDTGSGSGLGGFTPWAKLPVTIPPKQGTALAGTGYTDASGTLQGQIFYISSTGSIIEATTACTLPTGSCILSGIYTISNGVTSGINNSTGLAATLRSAIDGYRVFYHDTAGRVRQIRYSGPLNMTWGDGLPVINNTLESTTGLATDGGANLTTYGISPDGNILSELLLSNGTWRSLPAPQNLTAWSPINVTIAATFIASSLSKKLFYIGTDRALHEVDSSSDGFIWTIAPPQPANVWPLADDPNAFFATASSGATTTFFYISDGELVQATLENGIWQKAVTIFGSSSASSPSSAIPSATSGSSPTSSPLKGSNTSVEVGAGVAVGVSAMAAIGVFAFILSRRRRRQSNVEDPGPDVPEKDAQEVHAQPIYYELENDTQHELSGDGRGWESPKKTETDEHRARHREYWWCSGYSSS